MCAVIGVVAALTLQRCVAVVANTMSLVFYKAYRRMMNPEFYQRVQVNERVVLSTLFLIYSIVCRLLLQSLQSVLRLARRQAADRQHGLLFCPLALLQHDDVSTALV